MWPGLVVWPGGAGRRRKRKGSKHATPPWTHLYRLRAYCHQPTTTTTTTTTKKTTVPLTSSTTPLARLPLRQQQPIHAPLPAAAGGAHLVRPSTQCTQYFTSITHNNTTRQTYSLSHGRRKYTPLLDELLWPYKPGRLWRSSLYNLLDRI